MFNIEKKNCSSRTMLAASVNCTHGLIAQSVSGFEWNCRGIKSHSGQLSTAAMATIATSKNPSVEIIYIYI